MREKCLSTDDYYNNCYVRGTVDASSRAEIHETRSADGLRRKNRSIAPFPTHAAEGGPVLDIVILGLRSSSWVTEHEGANEARLLCNCSGAFSQIQHMPLQSAEREQQSPRKDPRLRCLFHPQWGWRAASMLLSA